MTFRTISLLALILGLAISAVAQDPPAPPADPIQQLNLTPAQRQQIRRIVQDIREERQSTNFRLREANQALDEPGNGADDDGERAHEDERGTRRADHGEDQLPT